VSAAGRSDLIRAWQGKRVLVVGDLVLDRYLFGRPARLSREAPVVILEHDGEEDTPGGAGNATRNVGALGGVPLTVGVIGDDGHGERLLGALASAGIDTTGIVRTSARATTAKTRILAGGVHSSKQQVLRIDRGERGELDASARSRLIASAVERLESADAVLFSDYGYGALAAAIREPLLAAAAERGIPTCADSRFELAAYRGVWIATPNEEEAAAAAGGGTHSAEAGAADARAPGAQAQGTIARSRVDADADAASYGPALLARLDARALLVTRGSRGMSLFLRGGDRLDIPVIGPDEVADVTGAGDTVASAVILGLAAGAGPRDAARLANAAASVVVMKRGAATATPDEVRRALVAAPNGERDATG
jgi:rfaE bifunctional protein kinase chain/domain